MLNSGLSVFNKVLLIYLLNNSNEMSGIIAAKIPFPSFKTLRSSFLDAMLDVAVYSIRGQQAHAGNRFSFSSPPSLTSGMTGPSIDICINVFTCSGSRRHLSDLRMRFSVEKDLSTPAVPMGINKILCASTLNLGHIKKHFYLRLVVLDPTIVFEY